MTESTVVINRSMIRLVTERTLLTLADSTYISSLTVLKDFDKNFLIVDKVEDLPEYKKNIRVFFKDHEKLWSHFDVEVRDTNDRDIFTTFPSQLFRLQRRDHYRLLAPQGSKTTFTFDGKKYEGFFTRDISAGGMLICTRTKSPLKIGDTLEDVRIFFKAIKNGKDFYHTEHVFHIPRGRVMYILQDDTLLFQRIGVAFLIKDVLRDEIMKFIRRCELELLRKWT